MVKNEIVTDSIQTKVLSVFLYISVYILKIKLRQHKTWFANILLSSTKVSNTKVSLWRVHVNTKAFEAPFLTSGIDTRVKKERYLSFVFVKIPVKNNYDLTSGWRNLFFYVHMYVLVKVCSGKRLAPRASHKLSNYRCCMCCFYFLGCLWKFNDWLTVAILIELSFIEIVC